LPGNAKVGNQLINRPKIGFYNQSGTASPFIIYVAPVIKKEITKLFTSPFGAVLEYLNFALHSDK